MLHCIISSFCFCLIYGASQPASTKSISHAIIDILLCRLAHVEQPLDTNHPVTTLLWLVPVNLHLQPQSSIELPGLYCFCELIQLSNSIRLDQLLVVEVVKQQVQPFARVVDLILVLRRCRSRHSLQVPLENLDQILCARRDVRPVAGRMLRLGRRRCARRGRSRCCLRRGRWTAVCGRGRSNGWTPGWRGRRVMLRWGWGILTWASLRRRCSCVWVATRRGRHRCLLGRLGELLLLCRWRRRIPV